MKPANLLSTASLLTATYINSGTVKQRKILSVLKMKNIYEDRFPRLSVGKINASLLIIIQALTLESAKDFSLAVGIRVSRRGRPVLPLYLPSLLPNALRLERRKRG
jgi:hypothetical protein